MDFPIRLIDGIDQEFVYGLEELRQSIYLLLKTDFGTFLQSPALGNRASAHTSDMDVLEVGITRCIEQIAGCSCSGVTISGGFIYVSVRYRGDVQNFNYSIASFNG